MVDENIIIGNLKSAPFFFISTGIAAGIYTAVLKGHEYYGFFRADVFLFVLLLVGLWFWLSAINPVWGRFNRCGQWVLYFLFGQVLLQSFLDCNKNNYAFSKSFGSTKPKFVKLRVLEPLAEKERNWRAAAEVLALADSNLQTYRACGRLLAYFPKKQYQKKPDVNYGDILLARYEVQEIQGAFLPGTFDFRKAMFPQQIAHQIFLKQESWKKAGKQAEVFRYWAFRCSENIEYKLRQLFPKRTAGIMASLLIGTRGGLEREDTEAFARTGTIHVLAVSGMHVTLICSTLSWFLNFGKIKKRKLPWKSAIIILLVWVYTFVTGLSPSIVRAALMFSIAEAGEAFFKTKGNLLNAVFTAMFLQLIYDPLVIFDVGFQLSYLAVLGIVFFNEPIKRFWKPYNRYLNLIWQSVLISIVATLATLPVMLWVFNAFPVWFVLANLLIVPLSSLLIYIGIAVLVLHSVPIAGGLLVKSCILITAFMLEINKGISDLPGRITQVHITAGAAFALLMALVFLGLYTGYFRFRIFYYGAIIFLAVVSISSVYQYATEINRRQLIFTCLRGKSMILIKDRREVLLAGTKSLLGEIQKQPHYNYAERISYCEIKNNTSLLWRGNTLNFSSDGKCKLDFAGNYIAINKKNGNYQIKKKADKKEDSGKLNLESYNVLCEIP